MCYGLYGNLVHEQRWRYRNSELAVPNMKAYGFSFMVPLIFKFSFVHLERLTRIVSRCARYLCLQLLPDSQSHASNCDDG